MGISMRQKYSTMSAAEHEQHVINNSSENQQVGEKIIRARIQAVHGETVTRQKNRDAINNTVGPRPRPPRLSRRDYHCRSSNSVWHGDGLHTFIEYANRSIDSYV